MQSSAKWLLITVFALGWRHIMASSVGPGTVRTNSAISKLRAFPPALRPIPGGATLPPSCSPPMEEKQNTKAKVPVKEDPLLADLDSILQRELSTNAPPLKVGEIVYL